MLAWETGCAVLPGVLGGLGFRRTLNHKLIGIANLADAVDEGFEECSGHGLTVDLRSAVLGPCRKTFLQNRNGLWRKGPTNKNQKLNPA